MFFKFPSYVGNGRIKFFDTKMRYGTTIDDISNYVTVTSGNYSLLDDFYNGESSDDVIKEVDGFYYYKDPKTNQNILISIDKEEKNIILPTYSSHGVSIKVVDGNIFRGMENDLDSIFIPKSIDSIGTCELFYKNLKIYYEGEDILGTSREIGGTYIDLITNEIITYKSIRYDLIKHSFKDYSKCYHTIKSLKMNKDVKRALLEVFDINKVK